MKNSVIKNNTTNYLLFIIGIRAGSWLFNNRGKLKKYAHLREITRIGIFLTKNQSTLTQYCEDQHVQNILQYTGPIIYLPQIF